MIYLDNAATTKVSEEVKAKMSDYLSDGYGNPSSNHKLGRESEKAINKSRKIIAEEINADSEEIVFTSGGTESNNTVIKGLLGKNDKVVTTVVEHKSILEACDKVEKKQGVRVKKLSVNDDGSVNISELKECLSSDVKLVSVIHGNNEIGTVNDIKRIGKLCSENNILFHTDVSQSFLKEDIDVEEMNIDLMTLNSHKIHGPKGVGALYLSEGVSIESLLDGGSHEFGVRAGTPSVHNIVGFGEAVKQWSEENNEKMKDLRDKLIEGLLDISDTILNGSEENRLCNNVNVSFKDVNGDDLVKHLGKEDIMVSTGSACEENKIELSHVIEALGLSEDWGRGTLRLTLSKYNSEEEIQIVIDKIKKTVKSLRKI